MIDSTPNRPRPRPAPTAVSDSAADTARTLTLTPRNATTRSRRWWRGEYTPKASSEIATRSAACSRRSGIRTPVIGEVFRQPCCALLDGSCEAAGSLLDRPPLRAPEDLRP